MALHQAARCRGPAPPTLPFLQRRRSVAQAAPPGQPGVPPHRRGALRTGVSLHVAALAFVGCCPARYCGCMGWCACVHPAARHTHCPTGLSTTCAVLASWLPGIPRASRRPTAIGTACALLASCLPCRMAQTHHHKAAPAVHAGLRFTPAGHLLEGWGGQGGVCRLQSTHPGHHPASPVWRRAGGGGRGGGSGDHW